MLYLQGASPCRHLRGRGGKIKAGRWWGSGWGQWGRKKKNPIIINQSNPSMTKENAALKHFLVFC